MAKVISCKVLQMPDGTSFANLADPCPVHLIGTDYIQDVTAASAGLQTESPATQSVITVNYYVENQVQTGQYWVGTTVSDLLTAINA
jgi:hypothetical protein